MTEREPRYHVRILKVRYDPQRKGVKQETIGSGSMGEEGKDAILDLLQRVRSRKEGP